MRLIFTIAWRNLLRHKGKSLVIGIILFFGALIMSLGNAVISGMDKGISENIMERFSGQIVLIATNQKEQSVFFTPMGKSIRIIPGYTNIKNILKKQEIIQQFMPMGRGTALVLSEEGEPAFTLLLGVKFNEYQAMFRTNIILAEGQYIKSNERGTLVTSGSREELYNYTSQWLVPENTSLIESNLSPLARSNRQSLIIKNDVVLMGFGSDNISRDIRVPVKGIFKYSALNQVWKFINIVDIESFRESHNYITAEDADVKLSGEKTALLSMDDKNLDNSFGDSITAAVETKAGGYDFSTLKRETYRKKTKVNLDAGAYNLVSIKLKKGIRLEPAVKKINEALKKNDLGAKAISWKKAIGQVADLAVIIRGALFGFVLFIFFVAVIIIMNTLSMSALERTSEIGMMRAVGAQKKFISRMFIAETFTLSFIFGTAGMIIGGIAVAVTSSMNIHSTNEILHLLFGGDTFKPFLNLSDVLLGIFQLLLVTIISVLYPIKVAKQITPLDAIQRD